MTLGVADTYTGQTTINGGVLDGGYGSMPSLRSRSIFARRASNSTARVGVVERVVVLLLLVLYRHWKDDPLRWHALVKRVVYGRHARTRRTQGEWPGTRERT